jgi:hypothetical protein
MRNEALLIRAKAMRDELVAVRREIHRHPELAFQERRTAEQAALPAPVVWSPRWTPGGRARPCLFGPIWTPCPSQRRPGRRMLLRSQA